MKEYCIISLILILLVTSGCINSRPYDVAIHNIGQTHYLNESKVLIGDYKISMGYIKPGIFKKHSFVQDSVRLTDIMTLSWKRDNGQSFSENFDLKNKFPVLGTDEYYIVVFKIDDNDKASVGVYICTYPNNCLDDWL